MDIFKLVGSVFIDTDKANESLAKTDEKAEGTGLSLKSMGEKAGKAALAVGSAAAAGAAALVGMANNAAKAADEVDKGSLRMGVSTDYYQELAYAAGQSGVEMGMLERAAKKLEGTDIGLEDALSQIMALGTEEERSAKAAELFGETVAYNLSPILAQSGDDFQGLMDRAGELGIVMSEDAVAAGVTLGDTMSDVQQSFGAVTNQLGATVMPIIQQVLDWVLEHMPEIQSTMETVFGVVQVVMEKAGEVLGWLTDKFSEYWPIISEAVSSAVDTIQEIWETTLRPTIETVWEWVQKMAGIIAGIWNDNIKPVLNAAWQFVQTLWNNSLKPIFNGVITFFKGVFSGDIKTAMAGLKEYISGIWNGIVTVIRTPVNTIVGIINGFIRGITGGINSVIRALNGLKIDVPKWVSDLTGVSSFGFNIPEVTAPQIPLLARGGDVEQSGAAIVGEAGPELLQLPRGARVTPLTGQAPAITVNVEVHPAPGMDEEALAQSVADRVSTIIQRQVDERRQAWA